MAAWYIERDGTKPASRNYGIVLPDGGCTVITSEDRRVTRRNEVVRVDMTRGECVMRGSPTEEAYIYTDVERPARSTELFSRRPEDRLL